MSWLADFAGKAEQLLNKVDQQAGKALNTPEQARAAASSKSYTATDGSSPSLSRSRSATATNVLSSAASNSALSSSGASASNLRAVKLLQPPRDSDEHLLNDFLNGKSDVARSNGHSRQSSTTSVGSVASSRASSRGHLSSDHAVFDLATDSSVTSSSNPSPRPLTPDEYLTPQPDGVVTASVSMVDNSSIILENKLLKNEITALNTEMMSLMERSRDSQDMVSAFEKRENMMRTNQSDCDEIIRDLRDRQDEWISRLNLSEDQVLQLEKRLNESKNQLTMKHEQFQTVSADRERILNDHTSVSGVQSQAMESLKTKLCNMETSMDDKDKLCNKLKMEAMDTQTTIDEERQDLSQSLASTQTKLHEEKNVTLDLNTKIRTLKQSNDQVKKELSLYKDKATRILQSKDKLLATLRSSTSSEGVISSNSSLSIELSEAVQERDTLRDEIIESHSSTESLKATIQEYESQLQMLAESNSDQLQSLQEIIDTEKQRRDDLESEFNKLKLELRYANDELHKQRLSANRQLTDRDSQIEVLRNQLTAKASSSSSTGDLERQIHSLTERLIQKQGLLEVLNTEKNSLVLQLERTEKQYRESEHAAMRNTSTTLHLPHDQSDADDTRQRLPTFLRSAVSDGQVTRRVKLAANTIDRFSIRLGIFLRRYPIARIFVIIYMALLHLWVTMVILTYQPEIHSNDFNPKQ